MCEHTPVAIPLQRYPYLLTSCAKHLEDTTTCETHKAVAMMLRVLAKDMVRAHNIKPEPIMIELQ